MVRLFSVMAFTLIALSMSARAFAQDPGNVDSLAFGNTDGSTIEVLIDHEVSIPIFMKCDENVAFVHFCLATENEFVAARTGVTAAGPLADWNIVGTLPVDGWPEDGMTSQSLVGIADFSLPEPNYINTDGEWLQVGTFRLITTDDLGAMGQTSNLQPGEDPLEGITVLFDEFWTPIVPALVFSPLYFLESTPPRFVSPPADTLILVNTSYPFSFSVVAVDDDQDSVTITADCPYSDYDFTLQESSPGYARYMFSWTPPQDCDSIVPVTFEAADTSGLTDELTININAEPVTIYVTSDSTLPGYEAFVDVSLIQNGSNSNVGGFNLTFLWDITGFDIDSVAFGSDFNDWQYLNASMEPSGPGSMFLVGIANLDDEHVPPMMPGEHHLATLFLSTVPDESYQGFSFPLNMPTNTYSQNVLTDSTGYILYHPNLIPGVIYFYYFEDILIGDINLNSHPYEMGDAVTFIDHIIDPVLHPFNRTQRFASDCNQDLIPETIADLVFLLNVINNGGGGGSLSISNGSAELHISGDFKLAQINLSSSLPAGGAYVKLDHTGVNIDNINTSSSSEIRYSDSGGILTAVIYGKTAGSEIDPGLISFDILSGQANNISIIEFSVSTPAGNLIQK